jgi:hypothetical protein
MDLGEILDIALAYGISFWAFLVVDCMAWIGLLKLSDIVHTTTIRYSASLLVATTSDI